MSYKYGIYVFAKSVLYSMLALNRGVRTPPPTTIKKMGNTAHIKKNFLFCALFGKYGYVPGEMSKIALTFIWY